jgi:cytosine/adenosine deaminase-related metal-dependent hydrolase
MPNGISNPPIGSKYVLEGRLITMGMQGVIQNGAIYIDNGEIKHVLPVSNATPAEFIGVKRIRTGDTIYPGLIELHNHLSYNAMQLWDVPKRFTNNGQWRTHSDYPRLITKPTQVLAGTEGIVEALIRYVECRALLGGVTTSQGITLSSEPGIISFYKGLVRNVEKGGNPLFPAAGTRIGNPTPGGAQTYLNNLQSQSCYLQHLSEGVDDTARSWFLNLQLDSGDWAITPALCGIHSTALQASDFAILQSHGGSMVWSPLSNYLLYGGTVDLQAAKASGILMGIGSDWAPSGSKNLLGELKVAWLANQAQGDIFTPEQLLAMATINAARILRWDGVLGSIEAGKQADFMLLNTRSGDPFMQVIEARESTITLVVIDGVPRLGQTSLMKRFGYTAGDVETIKIGSSTRWLNLVEANAHSLVQGLGLTEAVQRLQGAMADLPALARALDENSGSGLFSGSADPAGTRWRVVPDFENQAIDLALAAEPLSSFVQEPMELPGITVADDPGYLPALMAARNLPEVIKRGLPPLYGKQIPLPPSGEFLLPEADKMLPEVLATTAELRTFLRAWGELSLADRRTIVDQALILLEQNYVHLPFKRAMHAVDPLQRLRLLRYHLENIIDADMPPEIEFHNEIASIFNALRDLHTTYRLPTPFRGKYAWLPFTIEEYWEGDYRHYMLSKLVGQPGPPSFKKGVEVLYWNGMPIEKVVFQNAERQAGSNLAARWARGLNSLTIRPLAHGLPPDEEWVTLRYCYTDDDGKALTEEFSQKWLVFEPGRSPHSIDPEIGETLATALGLDPLTDDIQEAKRALYAGAIALQEQRSADAGEHKRIQNMTVMGALDTYLPTIFRAMQIPAGGKNYGYIRIFTFNVSDADAFVDEFVRLARNLPENGLIIDVRGNGGGLIYAAEQLLQVLTPRRIEPQRAQFINTPINLQICRNHMPSTRFAGLDLNSWVASIQQAVETGATYSLAFPITDEKLCNNRGQLYYGPVVLITDALCYSATDMFAAGFQDHGIGPVLGISENTGAGGANVWSHALLRQLMESDDPSALQSPYRTLPHGADLRVAVRRTVRVGANAGSVVEDLGIKPDHIHRMTRQDLLGNNDDLIAAAIDLLAGKVPHTILVSASPVSDGELPHLRIETRNVTRLDVHFNDRPRASLDIHQQPTEVDLPALVGMPEPGRRHLELRGYEGNELVVTYRVELA